MVRPAGGSDNLFNRAEAFVILVVIIGVVALTSTWWRGRLVRRVDPVLLLWMT